MNIIKERDDGYLKCVYQSAEERNNNIMALCSNGWVCISASGDNNELVAEFKKEE